MRTRILTTVFPKHIYIYICAPILSCSLWFETQLCATSRMAPPDTKGAKARAFHGMRAGVMLQALG